MRKIGEEMSKIVHLKYVSNGNFWSKHIFLMMKKNEKDNDIVIPFFSVFLIIFFNSNVKISFGVLFKDCMYVFNIWLIPTLLTLKLYNNGIIFKTILFS